jgi:hypothetical protein
MSATAFPAGAAPKAPEQHCMSATAFPAGAAPKAPGQHCISATAFPAGAAPKAPGQHSMTGVPLRRTAQIPAGRGAPRPLGPGGAPARSRPATPRRAICCGRRFGLLRRRAGEHDWAMHVNAATAAPSPVGVGGVR